MKKKKQILTKCCILVDHNIVTKFGFVTDVDFKKLKASKIVSFQMTQEADGREPNITLHSAIDREWIGGGEMTDEHIKWVASHDIRDCLDQRKLGVTVIEEDKKK